MKNTLLKLGRSGLAALLLCVGIPLYSQAPANDNCADAIMVTMGQMVSSSTEGATVETGIAYAGAECNAPDIDNVNDLGTWYSFVAPAAPVNVLMSGDFNVEVAVLSGGCQTLTCVESGTFFNGNGAGNTSTISSLQLTEGETYLVYTEGGGGQTGMFMVEVCGSEVACNDLEVSLDDDGNASITAMQVAMGTCDATGITLSQSDFTCADLGENTVTVTQGANTCDATVTVVDDTPPVIDCEATFPDVTVSCRADLPPVDFAIAAAATTDNCATFSGDPDVNPTGILSALTIIPGNTGCPEDTVNITRTYFLQDASGNQAQCVYTIKVVSPNGPTVMAPVDSLIDCGVTPAVSIADATATADCSAPTVTVTGPVLNGEPDVAGTTLTYTYTATDFCGRMASADQVFTVQDTTAPVIVCRDTTIALDAMGQNGFAPGDLVEVTDDCAPAGTAVGNPLQVFTCDQLGANVFVETRTDVAGNSSTCDVTVTVIDTLAPVITCQDVTVELDEEGNGSIATDDETAAIVTQFSGTLEDSSPSFDRPRNFGSGCDPTSTSTDNRYSTFSLSVDADDMYTFEMEEIADFDGYMIMYSESFDPTMPCVNYLDLADDEGDGNEPLLMIQLNLVPGEYILVATSFGSNDFADFVINISSENGGNVLSGGGGAVTSSAIDGGSSDNCEGVLTFSESVTEFTCDDLGPNTVTLTVTDESGISST